MWPRAFNSKTVETNKEGYYKMPNWLKKKSKLQPNTHRWWVDIVKDRDMGVLKFKVHKYVKKLEQINR